ncbi:MAG: extensin family protein [Myxococcaceae bacterium]|nr:MAG: extensin family protein [Myxococcaceae bacterium]
MSREIADLWSGGVSVVLGACAVFALIDGLAPPQDLPWTPLDIRHPIGAATQARISRFELSRAERPEVVEVRTDDCMRRLREAGVEVQRAEDLNDGGFCIVQGAVRITGGDVTPIAPADSPMQCPLALRYVIWDRQVLRPAAQAMGSEPASVQSYGTYSCRRIYGSTESADRPSEHARANALDIGSVTLKDGRTISVLDDWDGQGPGGAPAATFLRQARDGACRLFSTVLTPDYNAAHANHLHLDGAPHSLCAMGPSPEERRRLEAKAG